MRLAAPRFARTAALAVALAGACRADGVPPWAAPVSPASPSPALSPQAVRFTVTINLIRFQGTSCRGPRGPWRVRVRTPSPIEGMGRSRLRIPADGPGHLRYGFEAAHPGHGRVTYAGHLRVRLQGDAWPPVLEFSGTQSEVIYGLEHTGRGFGRATVRLGARCPG